MIDSTTIRLNLTAPARVWSRTEILASPCPVPASPGIYGWYFDELPHPDIDASQCTTFRGMPLLYVGISPARQGSQATMRVRLRQHLSGNVGGSTLRFTLGSLLSDRLGLQLGARNRSYGDGEVRLNSWIEAHAFVTFVVAPEPWKVEPQVVASLDLPLNLAMNRSHPFHAHLSAVRQHHLALARSITSGVPLNIELTPTIDPHPPVNQIASTAHTATDKVTTRGDPQRG